MIDYEKIRSLVEDGVRRGVITMPKPFLKAARPPPGKGAKHKPRGKKPIEKGPPAIPMSDAENLALKVPCPICEVKPGDLCTALTTGILVSRTHWSRISLAESLPLESSPTIYSPDQPDLPPAA